MGTYDANRAIFHIDRNRLFREALDVLFSNSSFEIAGGAGSFEEGLEQIFAINPKIILLDPAPLGFDKFRLFVKEILSNNHSPFFVVLTENLEFDDLGAALESGAAGYLVKDMSPDALQLSLELVLLGENVLPSNLACLITQSPFAAARKFASGGQVASEFSHREMDILSCLANGSSNKAIAKQLNIAEGTVKVHIKGILKKINVQNRTQAAIWVLQNGVVNDGQCPEHPAIVGPAMKEVG